MTVFVWEVLEVLEISLFDISNGVTGFSFWLHQWHVFTRLDATLLQQLSLSLILFVYCETEPVDFWCSMEAKEDHGSLSMGSTCIQLQGTCYWEYGGKKFKTFVPITVFIMPSPRLTNWYSKYLLASCFLKAYQGAEKSEIEPRVQSTTVPRELFKHTEETPSGHDAKKPKHERCGKRRSTRTTVCSMWYVQ